MRPTRAAARCSPRPAVHQPAPGAEPPAAAARSGPAVATVLGLPKARAASAAAVLVDAAASSLPPRARVTAVSIAAPPWAVAVVAAGGRRRLFRRFACGGLRLGRCDLRRWGGPNRFGRLAQDFARPVGIQHDEIHRPPVRTRLAGREHQHGAILHRIVRPAAEVQGAAGAITQSVHQRIGEVSRRWPPGLVLDRKLRRAQFRRLPRRTLGQRRQLLGDPPRKRVKFRLRQRIDRADPHGRRFVRGKGAAGAESGGEQDAQCGEFWRNGTPLMHALRLYPIPDVGVLADGGRREIRFPGRCG